MEQRYKVVLTGALAKGQTPETVKENLVRTFRISAERAGRLVSGNPVTASENLDLEAAKRFQATLEKSGLLSRLDPPDPEARPEAAPGQFARVGSPPPPASSPEEEIPARAAPASPPPPAPVAAGIDPAPAYTFRPLGGTAEEPAPSGTLYQPEPRQAPAAERPAGPLPYRAGIPDSERTSTGVEVTPRFFPLAFLLSACTPQVEIDGHVHDATWWRKVYYPLAPGTHTVSVYFSYLGRPQCGLNSKTVTLKAGAPGRIDYFMWPWIFAPGSMRVSGGQTGFADLRSGGAGPEPAGLGRRLGALVIDCLAVTLFVLLAALALAAAGLKGHQLDGPMAAISQAAMWLYFAILESSPGQATWGKRLLHLTVTDYRGRRIGFMQATLRHLARLVLLGLTMGLGFLTIAITRRKQGLHDLVTSTLVVVS